MILLIQDNRIIISTEINEISGTSVTNGIEIIASDVTSRFGLDPRRIVWIEHHRPSRRRGQCDDWGLVTSESILHDGQTTLFAEPCWHPMRAEDWYELGLSPASLLFKL